MAPRISKAFRIELDLRSGVPVYRQIIDQVLGGIAAGKLGSGDQLPTVRQLAVDLEINPNTVVRAYQELEIRGFLTTHQGTGTFVTQQKVKTDDAERRRRLTAVVADCLARAGAEGFTGQQVAERMREFLSEVSEKKKER